MQSHDRFGHPGRSSSTWGARVLVGLVGLAAGVAGEALAQDKAVPVAPSPQPVDSPVKPASGRPPANARTPRQLQGGPNTATKPNGVPNGAPAGGPNAAAPVDAGGGNEAPPAGGEPEAALKVDDAGMVTLPAFREPIELSTLLQLITELLQINVIGEPPSATVTFNAPIKISKDKLPALLAYLLEQQGYTIRNEKDIGFFVVEPINKTPPIMNGDEPRTKVIVTPNIRPSSLKPVLDAHFGGTGGSAVAGAAGVPNRGVPNPGQVMNEAGAGGGAAGPTAGGGAGHVVYIDELGVIVVTDTPRHLEQFESLVNLLLEEHRKTDYIVIPLKFIAAPVARQRALELIGQAAQSTGQNNQNRGFNPNVGEQPQVQAAAFKPASLDNLSDRLTTDPQNNALFFRGRPEERDVLDRIIHQIDRPSELSPKDYVVGSSAKQVAELARQRGLGEVTTIEAPQQNGNGMRGFSVYYDGSQNPNQRQGQAAQVSGGPVMVVDEQHGKVVYYATPQQHEEFQKLIDNIKVGDDAIVIRPYKLQHGNAERMAALIQGLITNTQPVEPNNSLSSTDASGKQTQQSTSSGSRSSFGNGGQPNINFNMPNIYGQQDQEGSISERAFVLADKANNQVLVKASVREQEQFEKLIKKLDLRRPQVFIQATIVSITADEELQFALESQLINAGGKGGVLNGNFGLGSFATGQTINGTKTVANNLKGLSGAIINSDQVPLIIQALQTRTNTRIRSVPQVLVDDNEEGNIEAKNQVATSQRNLGTNGNSDSVSFNGYEDAGTKLKVTPQIAGIDYLRLKIVGELSSFQGTPSADLPPPKQTNTIDIKSVQVPSNMTVVLGGVTSENISDGSSGIPFLRDLPLVGPLFGSTDNKKNRVLLYVFLTPKIIRDDGFGDVQLLTEGPQSASGLNPDLPAIKPVLINEFRASVPLPNMSRPTAGGGS